MDVHKVPMMKGELNDSARVEYEVKIKCRRSKYERRTPSVLKCKWPSKCEGQIRCVKDVNNSAYARDKHYAEGCKSLSLCERQIRSVKDVRVSAYAKDKHYAEGCGSLSLCLGRTQSEEAKDPLKLAR